jgi:hypothetical protein
VARGGIYRRIYDMQALIEVELEKEIAAVEEPDWEILSETFARFPKSWRNL